MKTDTGLVHIYCGNGKGKSTAAAGLAIRCVGGGGKVLYYQFLKDGSSGEISILKSVPNIKVIDGYQLAKFSFLMNDEEKAASKKYYTDKFHEITGQVTDGEYQLLIMDEALDAINAGFLDLDDMLTFLKTKPEALEVVLTGRNPKEELCEAADYITDMQKIKHPYDKGIGARKLIEK